MLILKGREFDKLYINSNGYTNVIIKNINSNTEYSEIHRALMSSPFCDEIIGEFTKEGDTVLDPFMGLATTGLSCVRYNRNFVGIELHKPYYDIAQELMIADNSQVTFDDILADYEK